jgi:hypothetical protein
MSQESPKSSASLFSRLPSIVWIPIIVLGIAALVGGGIGLFYLLFNVEGAASVIMIVIAWVVLRAGARVNVSTPDSPAAQLPGWVTALCILFFAVMGLVIDQTGNVLYNKPVEWLFCPAGTTLQRGVDVSHPLPGETVVNQTFSCVEGQQVVRGIGDFEPIAVRFVEYILIGYILLGLSRLYSRLRARSSPAS